MCKKISGLKYFPNPLPLGRYTLEFRDLAVLSGRKRSSFRVQIFFISERITNRGYDCSYFWAGVPNRTMPKRSRQRIYIQQRSMKTAALCHWCRYSISPEVGRRVSEFNIHWEFAHTSYFWYKSYFKRTYKYIRKCVSQKEV